MDAEKHKMRPHPNLHMHIGNSQMGKNWGEKEKDIHVVLLFIDMVWHYLLDPSKGLFGSSINVKNKGKEMSNIIVDKVQLWSILLQVFVAKLFAFLFVLEGCHECNL